MILPLTLISYGLCGTSVVLEWNKNTQYTGNEVVWHDSHFYIAERRVQGEVPSDSSKNWAECISLRKPTPFVQKNMYRTGEVVVYNNATWVAGHSTNNVLPDTAANKTAWIRTDLTQLHGPIYKLPPDPKITGMQTILGVDTDSDGVRDDLQRAITFAFSEDPEKRAAYMLYSVFSQQLVLLQDSIDG